MEFLHLLSLLVVNSVLQELTNPSPVFDKEFSFGDRIQQSYGLLANGSPNIKIQELRLYSESIWKDAVEYSSSSITLEQCLFENVEWFSTESSSVPFENVNVDEKFDDHTSEDTSSNFKCGSAIIGFPLSTFENKTVAKSIEAPVIQDCGTIAPDGERGHSLVEKRVRNNEACKKFRKARKCRREQLYIMEERMLKENSLLKNQINELEKEIEKWKEFFNKQK